MVSPSMVRNRVSMVCVIDVDIGKSSFLVLPRDQPAAQKSQWWRAEKLLSSCGCGVTSDIPVPPSLNDGHWTVAVDGLPLAAKLAHAARMFVARFCWSGLSGNWKGAFGCSNRYG